MHCGVIYLHRSYENVCLWLNQNIQINDDETIGLFSFLFFMTRHHPFIQSEKFGRIYDDRHPRGRTTFAYYLDVKPGDGCNAITLHIFEPRASTLINAHVLSGVLQGY